jgi:hypothetical protein
VPPLQGALFFPVLLSMRPVSIILAAILTPTPYNRVGTRALLDSDYCKHPDELTLISRFLFVL